MGVHFIILITKPRLSGEVFDYVEDCMYLCNVDSGLCPLKEERDSRSYAAMQWWPTRRQTVIFNCKLKVSVCTLLFVQGLNVSGVVETTNSNTNIWDSVYVLSLWVLTLD